MKTSSVDIQFLAKVVSQNYEGFPFYIDMLFINIPKKVNPLYLFYVRMRFNGCGHEKLGTSVILKQKHDEDAN